MLLKFTEERDHCRIKHGQIFWATASDPVVIAYHLLIDPVPASIADIILNRVITGQCSPPHATGRNEQPGCMTDCRYWLPSFIHLLNKMLDIGIHAQEVRIECTAW